VQHVRSSSQLGHDVNQITLFAQCAGKFVGAPKSGQ
jgi:hypothetical protein